MSDSFGNAVTLADEWITSGTTSAIGLAAGCAAGDAWEYTAGRQALGDEPGTIRDDAVFLVASITKPIVAMAALALVEEGRLGLGDRVTRFLPEFGPGKQAISVRHLLTHTSGLPDMLPNNRPLRERHATLADFVVGTIAATTDFPPGAGVQYQSMGFAVLGAIVEQITSLPLGRFCDERLFAPLGMQRTCLGPDDAWFEAGHDAAIVAVDVPPEQDPESDWGWNSRYWRAFGAPWGGMLTTPGDLARFARMMLRKGEGPTGRVLAPATIDVATRNQLGGFPDVREAERRCRGWGLGWRLQWPTHSASFGDLVGPRTYGHFGATGTLLWIDPDRESYGVVLTTTPFDPRNVPLARMSNLLAAATG